jgi:hypothetical protein
MTQVMLFAISPLYVLLVIAGIVFVILFSPGGRSALATNNAFYSAVLVADIIQSVLFYSIGMVLIVMGLRRVNWVVKGGKMFSGLLFPVSVQLSLPLFVDEGSAHPAHQDWQQQQPVYGQAYYPQYQYPAQPQPTPQLYSPEQAPQQLHVLQQSPQQTPPLDVQRQ